MIHFSKHTFLFHFIVKNMTQEKSFALFRFYLPGKEIWTDLIHVLQEVQLIIQIIIQV